MSIKNSFTKPLYSLALVSALSSCAVAANDVSINSANALGSYFTYDRNTNTVYSNN